MMNARLQITIVEPVTRIPACLSASPKKRSTRRPKTSRKTRPVNFTMSPHEAIHSAGTESQVMGCSSCRRMRRSGRWAPRATSCRVPLRASLDDGDLGVGCEQGLGEYVVEGEHAEEADHDGLVDGAADALGAAGGGHALVGADDRDDRAEQRGLDDAAP